MVADVELATSMIQLTGALLPIMVVITRYYLQNRTQSGSGETQEDLGGLLIINALYSLVVWAYIFSAILIVAETGLLLSLTVISYGLFLVSLFFYPLGWVGFIIFVATGGFVVLVYQGIRGFF